MAFNITEFRNHFLTFAQPNHFDMVFVGGENSAGVGLPKAMHYNEGDEYFFNRGIKHRAFSTQLPGRTLDVVERKYSGPTRLVPTGYVYQTLPISIYENHANNVKPFFDRWMETISSHDYWYTKYYDDIIVAELRLHLYPKNAMGDSAKDALPIKTYILKEVYPISVNAVQLDWNTTNAMTIINVELQYHHWERAEYTQYGDSFTPSSPEKPKQQTRTI